MNRESSLFIFIVLILSSCSVKQNNKLLLNSVEYDYVNPKLSNKEWEIKLTLNKDSTFLLQDLYGQSRLNQKGKWRYVRNGRKEIVIVLEDTTKVLKVQTLGPPLIKYTSNVDHKVYYDLESSYFPLVEKDTIVIKSNYLIFRNYVFTKSDHDDLSKRRVFMIEKSLIEEMGEENYIRYFGDSINKEIAKEKLMKLIYNPISK